MNDGRLFLVLVLVVLTFGCDGYFDDNVDVRTERNGTIRIATFNIQVFGVAKAKKDEVMVHLAKIIRRYDIVAVQEIKDISGETPKRFLALINSFDGAAYGMLLSARSGLQSDDIRSQEQYAYYYNTDTVRAVDDGDLFDDSPHDFFQREPFVARFAAVRGSFTFVLVNCHTKPDAQVTIKEIDALHDVIVRAKITYGDEEDFIIAGDLNAGCGAVVPEELESLFLRGDEYVWIVPDDADTHLGAGSCAYDRIVMTAATAEHFTGLWGIDRVFTNDAASDHWPVWAEFAFD